MKNPWMVAVLVAGACIQAQWLRAEAPTPEFAPAAFSVVPAAHQQYDYFASQGDDSDALNPPVPDKVIGDPLSNVQHDIAYSGYANQVAGGCDNCCDSCCDRFPWLPLIQPSDHCYDSFISPITNPVFFEDPRNLTEARLIFINHQLPPGLGSGDVQVVAMQIRAALTDRLSLIATKDGYIIAGNDAPHADGWADVAAGLKYNLFADPVTQRLLSAGFTFELPVGSTRAFQGTGDGEFNFFMTGGARFLQNWHWISAAGIRAPVNTVQEAPVIYSSNHIDRRLLGNTYFLMEFNTFHYVRDGQSAFNGINGMDLYNLGGRNIAGNNIMTGAFGFKWKPSGNSELGVAWELPLNTGRKDLLENRITADWILRF